MKVIRKIGFFSLLAAAALFAQDAVAVPTEILPDSSHYEGHTSYYDISSDGILSGRIDFAVYDTQTYPDEFIGADGFQAPGSDRYIYAYQIFHGPGNPLSYFAILGIEGVPVDGIGCQDDQSDGIASSDEYFTASEGVWEFQNEHGQGILSAGEHSWFLVLSSETDWVVGEYEIKAAGDFPVPVPEPAMIILLAIGGVLTVCARRRKSV